MFNPVVQTENGCTVYPVVKKGRFYNNRALPRISAFPCVLSACPELVEGRETVLIALIAKLEWVRLRYET